MPSTKLHSRVLNFNTQQDLPRARFEADLPKFQNLVKMNGGVFASELGKGEIRVLPDEGYAVMAFKLRGVGVALAAEEPGAEIAWHDLLQQHLGMLRGVGRPIPAALAKDCPVSCPWVGISLAPSFVDRTSSKDVSRLLSMLWTSAFCLL
jgi:hypothetical protein